MKPQPRIRKTIKWGGAAVTVLLVVGWVSSSRWTVTYSGGHIGRAQWGVGLVCGTLMVQAAWVRNPTPSAEPWRCSPNEERLAWWFGRWHDGTGGEWFEILFVPFWVLLACSGPTTVAAWRLDTLARRRAKLKLCASCGYERTGLRGGIGAKCPECGTVPASE
jgi:hypothetical protein